MKPTDNIYEVAFILLSSVGGAVLIIGALSSWLGKVWADRILESEKAKYARELDSIRHQFQVELNRVSIIHENQKVSFRNVIMALSTAIKALEQAYDETWHPINDRKYNELKNVVIEESLFLGKEGENALGVCLKFFGKSTYFPEIDIQSDRMLRNIYEFLNYIDTRIREYFRKRIGLSDEEDPLLEVYLLDICLILNDYHPRGGRYELDENFRFRFDIPPLVLIERYKLNLDLLRIWMQKFVVAVESDDDDKRFYFEDLSKIRLYLKLIGSKP